MAKMAEHLGVVAQRPDQETGVGPDVVWGLGGLQFWVIELKTGAAGDGISKADAGQLSQAMDWFARQYDQTCAGTPVMVHPSSRLMAEATAREGMVVVDAGMLEALRRAFSAYATGLSTVNWSRAEEVNMLLIGHRLTVLDLPRFTRAARPGR